MMKYEKQIIMAIIVLAIAIVSYRFMSKTYSCHEEGGNSHSCDHHTEHDHGHAPRESQY